MCLSSNRYNIDMSKDGETRQDRPHPEEATTCPK